MLADRPLPQYRALSSPPIGQPSACVPRRRRGTQAEGETGGPPGTPSGKAAGPKLFGFLEHGDKESRTPGICRAKAALYH